MPGNRPASLRPSAAPLEALTYLNTHRGRRNQPGHTDLCCAAESFRKRTNHGMLITTATSNFE